MPDISVSPVLGKFLHMLAKLKGARRILEIGTLGGYSTIWLARALPENGQLITLEIDPKHARIARRNLARAMLLGVAEVREGPAADLLRQLIAAGEPPFDMIFIDADKESYPEYFELSLKLSRPGTLIAADNVIRAGRVLDPKPGPPIRWWRAWRGSPMHLRIVRPPTAPSCSGLERRAMTAWRSPS